MHPYKPAFLFIFYCVILSLYFTPLPAQTLGSTAINTSTTTSVTTDTVQKPRDAWAWGHVGWFWVGAEAAASVAVQHHLFTARYAGMGTMVFAPVTPKNGGFQYSLWCH